jgi:hypothetical protein
MGLDRGRIALPTWARLGVESAEGMSVARQVRVAWLDKQSRAAHREIMLGAWSARRPTIRTELLLLLCAVAGCSEDLLGRLPSTPFAEPTHSGGIGPGGSGAGASGGNAGSAGAGASGAMGGGGTAGGGGSAGAAGSGLGGAGGAGGAGPCDPVGQVADFALIDQNPNSSTAGDPVSPRDYLQRVSGWFFGWVT